MPSISASAQPLRSSSLLSNQMHAFGALSASVVPAGTSWLPNLDSQDESLTELVAYTCTDACH